MVVKHHCAKEFMWIFGKPPQVQLKIVPLQKKQSNSIIFKTSHLVTNPQNVKTKTCFHKQKDML
jgi:hypothetical protein